MCANLLNLTRTKRKACNKNAPQRFPPNISCNYVTSSGDNEQRQITRLSLVSPLTAGAAEQKCPSRVAASENLRGKLNDDRPEPVRDPRTHNGKPSLTQKLSADVAGTYLEPCAGLPSTSLTRTEPHVTREILKRFAAQKTT